ncbi:MAG: hypothetical protein GY699_10775 [Desulfobacteraceae bacterium]|nr:hypothetical protein [Desulfobacteraceae bacterium]
MKKIIIIMVFLFLPHTILANDSNEFYPTAIFNFSEKGLQLKGMGETIGKLIFANLVISPNIALVDREEMAKLFDEAELNISGMVNPMQAIQVGQLTGAKIIITGTVFEVEDQLMIVAKIIGTETSRVLGASVSGDIDSKVTTLVEKLSSKVEKIITSKADVLTIKPVKRTDRIASLKKALGSQKKPSLSIDIKERHTNQTINDRAAETEMLFFASELGFEIIDIHKDTSRKPDILIQGESFAEFATRKGNIVGVKARLEVKAIDQRTNRILAVDRQTELEVDLAELIASKKALAKAAAKISERFFPKIVE